MPSTEKAKLAEIRHWILRRRNLILVAAVWHIVVAITMFSVGTTQLAPNDIYPNGIARFASDGVLYQQEFPDLRNALVTHGPLAWWNFPSQFHVRLYSITVIAFSRWFSFNILLIEPLNLIYYLLILTLVFKLGEMIFGFRAGLLAAAIVGLWPTLLLHTTQLLRDPLLIVIVLVIALAVVHCLTRSVSWRQALWLGLVATLAIVMLRITRLPMWNLLFVTVAFAMVFLLVRALRNREVRLGIAIFAGMVILAMGITPLFQKSFHNQQVLRRFRMIDPEEMQELRFDEQVAARRRGFLTRMDSEGNLFPAEDGSRVDADVQFHSLGDMVLHVPRALIIGFFAPFPNMWLKAGTQVGSGGRLLSGVEMIATYLIEGLALVGFWSRRKYPAAWFLAIFACLGVGALGLVVNNIGALYRLRYPFWVMLVVFAAGGVVVLISQRWPDLFPSLAGNHTGRP